MLKSLKINTLEILYLLVTFFICIYSECAASDFFTGGSCKYVKYEGQAKIISITSKSKHHHSHEVYEVKFSFISDRGSEVISAQTEGKEFVLLLNNSTYPGYKFLKKYKIQVGKVFKCYMKVIETGTCTPVVFDFPTIRLDDYCEN